MAKQGIIGWAKSNTNTIMEVGKSVWGIIQTNISVIVSFTGEILSLILSGGQACVEFILNMVCSRTSIWKILILYSTDCVFHCFVLLAGFKWYKVRSTPDRHLLWILLGEQTRRCIGKLYFRSSTVHVQMLHFHGTFYLARPYSFRCKSRIPAICPGCYTSRSSIPWKLLVCSSSFPWDVVGTGQILFRSAVIPLDVLRPTVLWTGNLRRDEGVSGWRVLENV